MSIRGRKKRKGSRHYCWACDRLLADEFFSGSGHARNLCRDCSRLDDAELERLQLLESVEGCFNGHGDVSRRSRKKLEQFLFHPDPEIRRYARTLARKSGDSLVAELLRRHGDCDDELFAAEGFDANLYYNPCFDAAERRAGKLADVWIESGPGMRDAVRFFDLIDVWVESGPCSDDVFDADDLTGVWIENGSSRSSVFRFHDPRKTPL